MASHLAQIQGQEYKYTCVKNKDRCPTNALHETDDCSDVNPNVPNLKPNLHDFMSGLDPAFSGSLLTNGFIKALDVGSYECY